MFDVVLFCVFVNEKIQDQYVDYMTEGQFVILTPVDIRIAGNQSENKEELIGKKEKRLLKIANDILHDLLKEEGLSFSIGVALQDDVKTDQQWFEKARDNMQEMKTQKIFQNSKKEGATSQSQSQTQTQIQQISMTNEYSVYSGGVSNDRGDGYYIQGDINVRNNSNMYDETMEKRLRRRSQQQV